MRSQTDPGGYTGAAAAGQAGGDNVFNYPITGSPTNTIYGQMMMYTGRVFPQYAYADTSFLHGTGDLAMHMSPPAIGLGQVDKPVDMLHPWDAVAAIFGHGTNQGTVTTPGEPVYTSTGAPLPDPTSPSSGGISYEQVPVAQFVASFADKPKEQIADLQKKLNEAGILGGYTPGLYDDGTRKAVFQLATYTAAKNDPHVSFTSLLDQSVQMARQLAGTKAQTITRHDTSTVLSDPVQAKALATAAAAQALGRNPTDAEMAAMTGALHSAEASHPQRSTTRTSTNALGQIVDQTSTTTGGLDQAGRDYVINQAAQASPNYRSTQAALTYFPALLQILQGVNNAGA